MCCFSLPVRNVSSTRIFTRVAGERQFLVYEMRLDSPVDVAMVLPIPVAASADKALRFISLVDYPGFFHDLTRCFPTRSHSGPLLGFAAAGRPVLKVERVGSFEASFVPTIGDFDRMDERFR